MPSDPIRRWADRHAALCTEMMAARASGDDAAYAAATAAVADHAALHPGHRRHPVRRCAWCAGPLPDDATGRYCCKGCARWGSA